MGYVESFSSRAFTLPGTRFPISVFTIRFPVFFDTCCIVYELVVDERQEIDSNGTRGALCCLLLLVTGKGAPMKILTGD